MLALLTTNNEHSLPCYNDGYIKTELYSKRVIKCEWQMSMSGR